MAAVRCEFSSFVVAKMVVSGALLVEGVENTGC